MHIPSRTLLFGALALGFPILLLTHARAGGGHYFPPATNAKVQEECGSCHMAFAPSMLPARSWQHMMDKLQNHFGDDASLDPKVAAEITDYLISHAADQGGQRYGRRLLRGIVPGDARLRITELPYWVRKHRKVPAQEWASPEVRTKANCSACHTQAERGYYED